MAETPEPGFAVNDTGPAGGDAQGKHEKKEEISDDELIDMVAEQITRRRLGVAAIMFLESSKPLSYIGSQFLVFMEPFVKTFFAARLYDRFAGLMEDREKYELLIRRIEQQEAETQKERKARRKADDDGGNQRKD